MSLDISILINSNRTYESNAKITVDSFYNLKSNKSFEIVVCSPRKPNDSRVRWVQDDKEIGTAYSSYIGAKECVGKYIFFSVDDHKIDGDFFGVVDFLESSLFTNRKFKITTLPGVGPISLTKFEIGGPRHPAYLIKTGNYCALPDSNVMCFPVILKSTLDNELEGYIYHPSLKCAGDVYLGLFLTMNGEMGIQYEKAWFSPPSHGETEMYQDVVIGRPTPKYFGESYINLYRLSKNYKAGMPYIYDDTSQYFSL